MRYGNQSTELEINEYIIPWLPTFLELNLALQKSNDIEKTQIGY